MVLIFLFNNFSLERFKPLLQYCRSYLHPSRGGRILCVPPRRVGPGEDISKVRSNERLYWIGLWGMSVEIARYESEVCVGI